jgi:hypothetical protein
MQSWEKSTLCRISQQVAGNPWNSKVFGVLPKSDRAEEYSAPAGVENRSTAPAGVENFLTAPAGVENFSTTPASVETVKICQPVLKTVKMRQPDYYFAYCDRFLAGPLAFDTGLLTVFSVHTGLRALLASTPARAYFLLSKPARSQSRLQKWAESVLKNPKNF